MYVGVGKSFLLQLYALLVNRDPSIVFSGREHLVYVLHAVAHAHAGSADAATWQELVDLRVDADANEVLKCVRNVVVQNQAPFAAEIGAAVAAYFDVITMEFPLMRDGAGEHLTRLMQSVDNLREDALRAAAYSAARNADIVPKEVVRYDDPVFDIFVDDGRGGGPVANDVGKHFVRVQAGEEQKKRAKWAAAERRDSPSEDTQLWKELERFAELEIVLNDVIKMSPRGLYRRHVMHEGIGYNEWAAIGPSCFLFAWSHLT
jgi:hypothetical protein